MTSLTGILRVCLAASAVAAASTGCTTLTAPATPTVSAAGSYRLIQEPNDGYRFATDLIAAATRSVRMTMYELTDHDVIAALINAHERGCAVKVLLDSAFHGRATNQAAYHRLSAAGVDVRWASAQLLYHQKSITIDDTKSAVSTANLVTHDYPTSRDAVIITTDHLDVAAIASTFDTDYTTQDDDHVPAGEPSPHLLWSPNAKPVFLQRITDATTSLDFTSEELTDRDVTAAISDTARRGVPCRAVLNADAARERAVHDITAAGCSVHLIPATSTGLYMHEKMLLTNSTELLVGSHNLTPTSLTANRELSLQLDTTTAPDVIAAAHATFEHDYQQSAPAPTSR